MNSHSPVALLSKVHVSFGPTEALCHIDLAVFAGQHAVIVGPNGAGKSTLLEVLAGVQRPTAGTIKRSALEVAFVPQRAAVPEGLPVTVREVVSMGTWGRLGSWRRSDAAARRDIVTAMERLDITALARRPFGTLSGGQRQRALLAQGLARGAQVLLLDEPTTGLDAESAARNREVVRAEADRGVAVVSVSHDSAVIAEADRAVRMEHGRIVADSASTHGRAPQAGTRIGRSVAART